MIHHGDCLEVLKTLEPESVDMVLADLPYGTTACSWDSVIPFAPLWSELNRVCKPRGALLFFGSEPFSTALRTSNIKNFKYDWVWHKSNGGGFLNANRQPLKRHETVSVFSRGQATYFPQKSQGKPYTCRRASAGETTRDQSVAGWVTKNEGSRFPTSYLKFSNETGSHPTQKPVLLLEYLIRSYTSPGQTVLDPTAGSGSTGVGCVNVGRQFIGIEREQKYFEIMKRRIEHVNKSQGCGDSA